MGTCPELQQQRLKVSRMHIASRYNEFVQAAVHFPLNPIYDKSERMIGDESYENMVNYHIDIPNQFPSSVFIQNKINAKKFARSHGVPTTTSYYGAHKREWDRSIFAARMKALCNE